VTTIMTTPTPRYLNHPLSVGPAGTLRTTDPDDHVRDLILQVLLTEPGERVNLPEFGCGLRRLVFAGDNEVLRATAQLLISQNLARWLGDRIDLVRVGVAGDPGVDPALHVDIEYSVRPARVRRQLSFTVAP